MKALIILAVSTVMVWSGFADMERGGHHATDGWAIVIMGCLIVFVYIGVELERIADKK